VKKSMVLVLKCRFEKYSPNKCIMVGILLAEKALLKSPYAKR
jgi:hypothetical protein